MALCALERVIHTITAASAVNQAVIKQKTRVDRRAQHGLTMLAISRAFPNLFKQIGSPQVVAGDYYANQTVR